MRLFLISFIFLFQYSYAQTDTTFYFKEFGWRLTIPSDFKLVENIKSKSRDENEIIPLISIKREAGNLFIANYGVTKEIIAKNYDSAAQVAKIMFFNSVPSDMRNNIDSASSIIVLDGVSFNQYDVWFNRADKAKITTSILTTFYKSKFLIFNLAYTNDETKNQIFKMLKNSKFEK